MADEFGALILANQFKLRIKNKPAIKSGQQTSGNITGRINQTTLSLRLFVHVLIDCS